MKVKNMGIFDNYNYEINKRLPEYWKQDVFLTPIERFSALLMRNSIQRFMEKMGVMQPFMVWKTLPEEYHWEWGFDDYDVRLASHEENENCNQTLMLSESNHIVAQLPLTKRNVHAYIVIELSSLSFSDTTEYTDIKELVIKNAEQTLKIKDINSKTTIEIYTEDNKILIDDSEPAEGQIEGSIDIIKRVQREDPNNITDPLDINESCEIEIYLPNGESAYCNLFTRLYYPVYVTEQNIRLFTLSAFPLEYVRLYGYMCHKHNNNHQWVYLWEKQYAYQDRIVYDRVTKQYDCEIFYIEVKLYGLPAPIYVGFPAFEADSTEGIFSLNESLDYWGGIYHIPRRYYKTSIPEEDERYCFPKYYDYPIEQDYPYEQRIINEYKYNEDWEDYINIRDVEGTDLALVRCKDPYIENLYMYTETIPPTDLLNSQATFLPVCVKEKNINDENIKQIEWQNENNLRYDSKSYSIISLNKRDEEHITDKSYKANVLSLEYDLSSLPENCNVKGMQLKFKGTSNTHANNIILDDRSFLKYTQKTKNSTTGNHTWKEMEVQLSPVFDEWTPDNATYTLGTKDSIFNEEKYESIDRDSIRKGYLRDGIYQTNKIRIDIGFSNQSDYLDLIIKLFDIKLIVYFDLIQEDVDLKVSIPDKTIICDNETAETTALNIAMTYENQGEMQEIEYNSFVIIPPELQFVQYDDTAKELSLNEVDTITDIILGDEDKTDYVMEDDNYHVLHIGESWNTNIQIAAKFDEETQEFNTGRYDIVFVCGKHIYTEEIYVYDKEFAIRTEYEANTPSDVVMYFSESIIDAVEGNAAINLKILQKEKPLAFQYVVIEDIEENIKYYCISDKNGEIRKDIPVKKTTALQANYGDISTVCYVISAKLNINLYHIIQEKEEDVIDMTYLSYALLKNPSNASIDNVMTQLANKQQVSDTSLVKQSDSYICSQEYLENKTKYTLVVYATVMKSDSTTENVKYTCSFNSGSLTNKDSEYTRIYIYDENDNKVITDLNFIKYM